MIWFTHNQQWRLQSLETAIAEMPKTVYSVYIRRQIDSTENECMAQSHSWFNYMNLAFAAQKYIFIESLHRANGNSTNCRSKNCTRIQTNGRGQKIANSNWTREREKKHTPCQASKPSRINQCEQRKCERASERETHRRKNRLRKM